MRFWNYFEFLTKCRKPHPFSSRSLKLTSKTNLILQFKNGEKNATSFLTVLALSNKVSFQIDWRFFHFIFGSQYNAKHLCYIFLVDFNLSESLGLQLKQKGEHNIYFRIFWNPILRGESYHAFMQNRMLGCLENP